MVNETKFPATMTAVRLHGPRDMRVDSVPHPGAPGPGEVLLQVTAVGICGSDLHTYKDGRIGSTFVESPVTMGHEFAGILEAVGPDAVDGNFQPLLPGTRVAVDPAQPCHRCEMCQQGHPNLCHRLHFCGLYPDEGSLSQWMHVPANTCFPVPDDMDNAAAAMLEPLGIAIHATDLARIRIADSVVIVGAGPIGLCLLQTIKLAGAHPIYVTDKLPWRLALAEKLGGIPINFDEGDPVQVVWEATNGRGVDVALEAAWADHSVQQAAEMLRLGGRLVLVGIPEDDRLELQHSVIRRKGLTMRVCRRMKHTYPRAIRLATSGLADLHSLISHHVPLAETPAAFEMNVNYADNVVKIMVDVT